MHTPMYNLKTECSCFDTQNESTFNLDRRYEHMQINIISLTSHVKPSFQFLHTETYDM